MPLLLVIVSALLVCLCCCNAWPTGPLKPGVPQPQALQGHDDHVTARMLNSSQLPTPALLQRYNVVATMTPGIRRYNLFWNTFETVPSQPTPFECPAGSRLVPATQADRQRLGYERFHCYSESALAGTKTQFRLDNLTGAQGAGILYSAPAFYRHPNCTGFPFGKGIVEKGGCVPQPQHMGDYADYVRTMLTEFGFYLRHLVVWNEVASAAWMDSSPTLPNRAGPNGSNPLTPDQFKTWVTTYATLLRRTNEAVRACVRVRVCCASHCRLRVSRFCVRTLAALLLPLHTDIR